MKMHRQVWSYLSWTDFHPYNHCYCMPLVFYDSCQSSLRNCCFSFTPHQGETNIYYSSENERLCSRPYSMVRWPKSSLWSELWLICGWAMAMRMPSLDCVTNFLGFVWASCHFGLLWLAIISSLFVASSSPPFSRATFSAETDSLYHA